MKTRVLTLLATLIAAMMIAGCATGGEGDGGGEADIPEDEWGVIEIGPDDPIRISANVVTSGEGVDVFGLNQIRFAELAVEDAGGELFGRDIELVEEDTLCSAEGGQTVANRTISDDTIVAVMGHTCSSSCTPASEIYTEANYTMVSPSCTAPALTDPETHNIGFLRTAFNDVGQGAAAADYVYNELGITRVATIQDGSPYAEQLVNVFTENFEEFGGEIVEAQAVNVGDTDMRPVLTTIAEADPELIYSPVFPAEGGFIAQQRADVGLEGVPMMGADGLNSDTFLEAAGDAANGSFVSGPGSPDSPEFQAVIDAYVEAYSEEPPAPFGPQAYDATAIILQAIEDAAVEGDDGTLYIGRQALSDALYSISDYEGIIGTITCNENGDCGFSVAIAIFEIQDGAFEVVD